MAIPACPCGCAVVAVDHHRKDGDQDAINDILGATSKSAAIDTAWGLFRAGYGAKLSVRGRDVQDLEIRLRFDEVRGRAVKKKGMVFGAGPAVMECAITAAKRGHDEAFNQRILQTFGSAPTYQYFDTPVIVDNERRDVFVEAAD